MYQFLFQQETGNCGLQIFCDANDGGMRPVGGAKGIVNIDFSQAGESFGKIRTVLLFFGVKAQIFQQQYIAAFHRFDRGFSFRPHAIAGGRYRFLDQFS